MHPIRPTLAALLAVIAIVVAACGGGATPSAATPSAPASSSSAPSDAASPSTAAPEPAALTVGLGFIPSVQFAQFYLAAAGGLLRRRGPQRDAPEQDRPRPHHAPGAGRGRHRLRRRDVGHPGGQPGHPGRVRRDDLRQVPERRHRQGGLGDRHRGRPQGQEDRHPGQVRQLVDHAPGAAPVGRPHRRRRRDRRVPGLRPGDRAPAGRRRRRDGLREQRADPAPERGHRARRADGRRRRAAAGAGPRDGDRDAGRQGRTRCSAFTDATLRAMDEIAADPQVGLDATFELVPDLAAGPGAPAPDPRRDDRDLGRRRRTGRSTATAGSSRSTSWARSGSSRTPSRSTSWWTTRCSGPDRRCPRADRPSCAFTGRSSAAMLGSPPGRSCTGVALSDRRSRSRHA